MHLSETFNSSLKSLSDRVESGFALMERGFNHFEHRFNSVEQRLDRLEADLNRPAHHFFSKIEKGMAEHLSPDQQLNVLQACNNAFLQAMQHNRYGQQSVVSFPPVPPLTRFTSLPTCAAYHCTDTSLQRLDTHRYTTTSLSAAGHFTDTTMASAAPVWSTTANPMHAWSSATTRQTWNSPAATTTCSSPATTTLQTWAITAATSPPARTSTEQEEQHQPPQQQQPTQQTPPQQQQPPQQQPPPQQQQPPQQQPPPQQQQQPPQQQPPPQQQQQPPQQQLPPQQQPPPQQQQPYQQTGDLHSIFAPTSRRNQSRRALGQSRSRHTSLRRHAITTNVTEQISSPTSVPSLIPLTGLPSPTSFVAPSPQTPSSTASVAYSLHTPKLKPSAPKRRKK
ncbi:uncharacterized protein [Dendrobates tinctorius]|uniref:uncharacterized protein n=1 Tax=Dendrobates tinctorius TaxID=92724 RepID=UPI003CC9D3C7